jgi:hypothetical protein
MSTVGPDHVLEVAARLPDGVELVDAPVLGGVANAVDGTLQIFVGGSRRVGRWLVDLVASPAAPRQTVHAVLPHTAFRHRSPSGMRSLVADRAGQAVHAKAAEPPAVIAAGPVAASAAVLVAGEDGQAFVDVPVDGRELGR